MCYVGAGYADSTGHPTEDGLVDDSVSVFKWLKRQTGDVPVYIWRHSLGSAYVLATNLNTPFMDLVFW